MSKCKEVVRVSSDKALSHYTVSSIDYTPYFEDLGFKETCHAGRSVAPAKRFHFIKRLINLDYKVAKTVIKTHLLTEDNCMIKVGCSQTAMAKDLDRIQCRTKC